MINVAPQTFEAEVVIMVPATFRVRFEYVPGTPDVPMLGPDIDPGYPGENPLCTVTEIFECWYEDHLITNNDKPRHLLESSLRSPEHAESVQAQLLKQCEEER